MFPYDFYKRRDTTRDRKPLKKEPTEFHDRLSRGCLDIAFEIVWTTLTFPFLIGRLATVNL